MDKKDKFKPLPKPVATPFRRGSQTVKPFTPVDPDDFEIPERKQHVEAEREPIRKQSTDTGREPIHRQRTYNGREPIRGKRLNENGSESFGEALGIFFGRLLKKAAKSINRLLQKIQTQNQPAHTGHNHTAGESQSQKPQSSRESKRQAVLRKRRRKVIARLSGIAALGVLTVTTLVFVIIWLTGKNAYEISIGEEVLGYIALSEDITAEKIQAQAVAGLERTLGAKVQVDSQVSIKEVNVGRDKISADEVMSDLISRNFTYKIAATAIVVNGQEIAVLKTNEEAESVEEKLQAPYVTDTTKTAEFVEDFKYEARFVSADALDTAEDALVQLDKKTRSLEDYVIKSGDTLDAIAIEYGVTTNKICEDTPGLTLTTILQPGDTIKLEMTRPYLSVRTVDEVKRTETIPMETETRENPSQSKSYTNVIQEGRAGEEEVTVRITRVNGILEKPEEEISRVPTVNMVTRIEEIGTGEVTPR